VILPRRSLDIGTERVILLERHLRVSQPVVDDHARADETFDRLDDVPDIHSHPCDDATFEQPERDELASCGIAATATPVPRSMRTP
jgi:hypothetical protein